LFMKLRGHPVCDSPGKKPQRIKFSREGPLGITNPAHQTIFQIEKILSPSLTLPDTGKLIPPKLIPHTNRNPTTGGRISRYRLRKLPRGAERGWMGGGGRVFPMLRPQKACWKALYSSLVKDSYERGSAGYIGIRNLKSGESMGREKEYSRF